MTSSTLRTKYPAIEPYKTGYLQADAEHTVYFEESGNPNGIPVIFLHGGPGAGTEPSHRQYFDPSKYRIVLMDQRGCGKSEPFASLNNNSTWHLVGDIEQLRRKLKIEKWLVFGGSWGSTLSLSYAIKHPSSVMGLVLRGIFLCRPEEIKWFYQSGAHNLFPDAWEKYLAPIPENERHDLVAAYHKRLTGNDEVKKLEAAKAWALWEGSTIKLIQDPNLMNHFNSDHFSTAFARIENHFFTNNAFFTTDNWLLENVHVLREHKIKAWIVHGRYDVCTPMKNAWDLHKAWPEATLNIIPDSGHAASEPGIIDALVRATDEFAGL